MKEKYISNPNINKRVDTWLPIILLALVGLCIFLTERHDGGSIEGSISDGTSAHGITLSKNLMNSEHTLFMFSSRELQDVKIVYEAYNRFPVFPFLLTGLLIHPFEQNLTLQIYIARQLMNIFFFLSIIVVFKLADKLVKNKYLALSVALISFSSYYMLSLNNMIFNDIPTIFGFVVALYCVVTAQKTKLKISRILFYSILPVSLGWQPYAVFGTWLLVDVIELLLERKTTMRMRISNLLRRPSFKITGLAITWGVLILGLQLFNEWRIVGGSFVDLPSVSSGLWKSGLASAAGHTSLMWTFEWFTFLPSQAHSIAVMLIPFWPIFQIEPGINASIFIVVSLIIYTLLKYLKDRSSINKVHLVMIFSGMLWTIPMRQFVALHDFQSIFYVGFAISVYLALLSYINLRAWKLFAINVTLFFLITVSLSNYYKKPHSSMITNQFQNIQNQLPENSKIYFEEDRKRMKGFSRYAIELYLIGSFFTQQNEADYAISKNPDFNGEKLTSNKEFNLFKVSGKTNTSQP